MARKSTKTKAVEAGIVTYKGFDKDLKCKGFQFEIGKTFENGGKPVVRCGEGAFHACENPFDVWNYYAPTNGNRFALTSSLGQTARDPQIDTKIASAQIEIKIELSMPEFIRRGVEWILSKATEVKADSAATTGYGAPTATTGYGAPAATTGERAPAATTGERAPAATTGERAPASTTGERAPAATTGYGAPAATTGYGAPAATTGYGAPAATTGDRAPAATTGNGAPAATTGERAPAATTGKNSVAAALGVAGKAKAGEGGAIMLAAYDDDNKLVAVRASLVGENGIQPGKFYRLLATGEFEEIAE